MLRFLITSSTSETTSVSSFPSAFVGRISHVISDAEYDDEKLITVENDPQFLQNFVPQVHSEAVKSLPELRELIEKFSNDADLGREIRKLYYQFV